MVQVWRSCWATAPRSTAPSVDRAAFVGTSFENPLSTAEVGLSTARLLEMLRHLKPDTTFHQASMSETTAPIEHAAIRNGRDLAVRPYVAAKLFAHSITRIYRPAHVSHAPASIPFNDESPLRGREFLTRKIGNAVAKIRIGTEDSLQSGGLEARHS